MFGSWAAGRGTDSSTDRRWESMWRGGSWMGQRAKKDFRWAAKRRCKGERCFREDETKQRGNEVTKKTPPLRCSNYGDSRIAARCGIHSLDLACFHQRTRPTIRPSPPVPSMKGRANGMASQERTTSPIETMAPTGVPGTVKPPYRPMKLDLRSGMTSPAHQPKDQPNQPT